MLPPLRSVPRVRQHDATDCGAACLEAVARYYGRRVPIARIRQHASTDRRGTTVLGMVDAATRLGFSAKGVKGPPEVLPRVPLPAIAHLADGSGRSHFVVLCAADERRLRVMDPADGRIHRLGTEEFAGRWSGVLVLLVPGEEFRPGGHGTGTLRRFWGLARPSGATLLQALLGAVLYTLLGLSGAVYVQKIVDDVIPDGSRGLLNLLSLAMLGVITAQVYIGAVKDLLCLGAGQRIDAELILGYYRHLLRLPQRFFDTMRVGEIVSRVNDAVKIRTFINTTTVGLLVDALVVCSALALMTAYSARLALLVGAALPLYAALLWVANRLNRRNERALMERAADLESQLVESLGAARTLKHFSLEPYSELRTETRLVRLLRPVYLAGTSAILIGSACEVVARGAMVLVLWSGSALVLQAGLTPGQLMSFYALVGYLTGPMTRLVRANQGVQDALIAADRLFEILDLEREPEGGPIPLARERIGDIRFESVRFRYGAGRPTFDGLDLCLPHGRVTAVVGESGSGKTTLALLLQGLYPIESGTIRIGGHDLRSLSVESLRRCIGVVPQEVHLFAGDVLENVVLDDPQPDLPRVLRICDELGITEFVEQLPGGFRGHLGERGAVLSGGQRQRLAIARALYREPEILVLDEATSSLDPLSERFVRRAVRRLREEGRTVVQIAHRLTAVVAADRILVLERGRLAEEGSHAELLRRDGVYARLWREQFPPVHAAAWGAERGGGVEPVGARSRSPLRRPPLTCSIMPGRYFTRLAERPRAVTPLRVAVGVFLSLWWGTALLSGYRAIHQIREVRVGATARLLLPGTLLSGSVATSGRTEGSLTLELVQDTVRETLAVVYLPRNRDAPMDPRSQRGRISVAVTPATIARFQPGPARLRATGLGSPQWLRVPPPTVREVAVEIPAVRGPRRSSEGP